ncbi:MAG: toll/interleukin-1 receptor domain-containing protein, partial [Gammaproteobacteria bacterium]|nr:toll/interleukin-1 receptor domain-containing protein [Gammaproteobacteria bacterium]
MTGFRYKAFISYSHRDEKWASWLHKALESYRLPRQLVGRTTRYGEVPARFYPVFRDRDELSSGASLSDRVSEALDESESLIVVCSPAAAASKWVNEEIRVFRALGRGER